MRYASRIREDFPPRTFLLVLLNYKALGWAFTIYWQSPRMSYCPRIGPWPNILFRDLTPTIFMWFGNLLMSLFTRKKKYKMRQCNFLSQNNTPNFNLKQQFFYHTHIIHNGLKNEPKKPKPPLHGLIEKTSLKTVTLLYQVG